MRQYLLQRSIYFKQTLGKTRHRSLGPSTLGFAEVLKPAFYQTKVLMAFREVGA